MTSSKSRNINYVGFFALLFLFVSFFIGGCASNIPTGQWESDLGVKNNFETGTAVPNHTYYYWGSYNSPDAIIAIDNHYTLREGNVWAKAEGVPDDSLKKWFSLYKTKGERQAFYSGGVISAPDGRQAGIWYSLCANNIVQMPTPRELVIFQPTE